jgi:hypothetical protein
MPEFGLPVVALVANVLAIGALLVVLKSGEGRVRVVWDAGRAPADAPVLLAVSSTDIRLDGKPVATLGDLERLLEGRSAEGATMRLVVGDRVDGPFLARLLQVCARSGFASVRVELLPVGGTP